VFSEKIPLFLSSQSEILVKLNSSVFWYADERIRRYIGTYCAAITSEVKHPLFR